MESVDNITTVRRALASDVDWMIPELRTFADSYGTTKKSLFGDEDHVRKTLAAVIEHHVCFVAEKNGVRAGLIAGFLAKHPFNPEIRVLAEALFWVSEHERGTWIAQELLTHFIEWGKANCDWITFALTSKTPGRLISLYRHGFRIHENNFLLEVA